MNENVQEHLWVSHDFKNCSLTLKVATIIYFRSSVIVLPQESMHGFTLNFTLS